jgi:hypothetical protein
MLCVPYLGRLGALTAVMEVGCGQGQAESPWRAELISVPHSLVDSHLGIFLCCVHASCVFTLLPNTLKSIPKFGTRGAEVLEGKQMHKLADWGERGCQLWLLALLV